MSSTIQIQDNFLEINLTGRSTLEELLYQLSEVISIVAKTKSKYLLVNVSAESCLTAKEDIEIFISKIHQKTLALQNINIFTKVAISFDSSTLYVIDLHKKILEPTGLNIQLFDSIKNAISWLDIESSVDNITAFFQPIISLKDNRVIGYEALARKVVNNKIIPIPEWLPQLFNEKLGSYRLTEKMLALAEKKANQLKDNQYISVNFEVDEINSNSIESLLAPFDKEQFRQKLVVEVCERGDILINHKQLITNLQKLNVRIALDDVGAGNARFLEILDFSPEIIKLDKKITDRMLENKVASFISFFGTWCKDNEISLLAEGIETQEIAMACKQAGINFGQGFLFGKPQAELLIINNEKFI